MYLRTFLLVTILAPLNLSRIEAAPAVDAPALLVNQVQYDGVLTDDRAGFDVQLDIESLSRDEVSLSLFEGDVALLAPRLTGGLRIVREGNVYRLVVSRAGRHQIELELVAKIDRVDPWDQISFLGPAASIAKITARAPGQDMELQLLEGTLLESVPGDGEATLTAYLGSTRTVSLRWRSKAVEAARQAVLTGETASQVQVNPTVIKYQTTIQYEILQGNLPRLSVLLADGQALTQVDGEQIRDWQVVVEEGRRVLAVEFIKPVENAYRLTLLTEQTVNATPSVVALVPPQPLDLERDAGSIVVSAEDVVVETESADGLRQVNAPAGALERYQFFSRPFTLRLGLQRIEPLIKVASRVTARLEETRLLVRQAVNLNVEKAGIYSVELSPLGDLVVADVVGDGIEDWKTVEGRLIVEFANRVLGARALEVQMEQAIKTFPEVIVLTPLRVAGVEKETAQVGAGSEPGIRLKTKELVGLREIPVTSLPGRVDELLAYTADDPAWSLTLSCVRLDARVLADVFNLVTVGDGLIGGSATIRYAVANQGVQEFRVRVPAHWKNIEFTGPNIRSKEQRGEVWTIGLQDKVWGSYTLVVTYDFQFDPHQATLSVGGIHPLDVERETGSVAITSAASLLLSEHSLTNAVHRVDETELAASDRALITRPAMLAYQYAGDDYELSIEVKRFEESTVLQAVADRSQFTTVLTDAGQMLTQASFMVKNSGKQYQLFRLPADADFYACYVGGQPVKPERDPGGAGLLVPLSQVAARDDAVPVEIVYAQKIGPLKSWRPDSIALSALQTDVQTTYAEWELYVPNTHLLTGFGGNMTVTRGATYGMRDAWRRFVQFYKHLLLEGGAALLVFGLVALGLLTLVIAAMRRRWGVAFAIAAAFVVVTMLRFMMVSLPSREMARQISRMDTDRPAAELQSDISDVAGEELDLVAAPPRREVAEETRQAADGRAGGDGLAPAGRPAPAVAGLRPLRIEIPRTGTRFTFTKVLNVNDEALTIRAWAMTVKARNLVRGGLQLLAFLLGALLLWRQSRRGKASAFLVALGTALVVGAVGNLLIAARLLHVGLVMVPPLLVVLGLAWLARRMWRRSVDRGQGSSPGNKHGAPLVIAAVALMVFLPATMGRADDQALDAQAPAMPAPAETGVSILSAHYAGQIRQLDEKTLLQVAEFKATIELSTTAPGQTVRLFDSEVAIQKIDSGAGFFSRSNAKLLRDDQAIGVLIPRPGETTLRIEFLAKVTGDATKRKLAFARPAALSSRFELFIDEPEADVEFPSAVSFTAKTIEDRTRVDAVMGAGQKVELEWTPRGKRAEEIEAVVFCDNTTLVTLGDGAVNTRAQLRYLVSQGELRRLRVRLPRGQQLLRVQGDLIRTWELTEENGDQVLSVELLRGLSATNYLFQVETESALGDLPGQFTVRVPQALDVVRETGMLALRRGDELSLTVESSGDLQKMDVSQFLEAIQTSTGASDWVGANPTMAYRFLKPDIELMVRAEPVQPEIEAVVHNHILVHTEQVTLTAQVDYTIKRAGVFALRLELPADYRVENVTGDKLLQWFVTEVDARPVLEVKLRERVLGPYRLRVDLSRLLTSLPDAIPAVAVHPLETERLTGYVSVSTETGLQARTESFDGLTEIPARSVPGGLAAAREPGMLAYKFIISEPGQRPDWALVVGLQSVESWVRAEAVNWYDLSETLVSGRTIIRFEIQNAPIKVFRLRVPASFKNVEITGSNIRRRDQAGDTWRVELQSRVIGDYVLTVHWDQDWNVRDGILTVDGVQALDVERETGALAIGVNPPLRATEKTASADLLRVDARELPDWAGKASRGTVLAYRYLRPGYELTVAVDRFDEAEVLQAMVDWARLRTVVADDGQMMTEMVLSIRNNARQFLEVTLPAGAQIWSAFVAGRAVRPSQRDGALLLPLERSGSDEQAIQVEVIYVGQEAFPRTRGRVTLETPSLDIPLKNARWELYLPPNYRFSGFAGTMTRQLETAVYRGFSLGEYTKIEHDKKDHYRSITRSKLEWAQQELERGNVKGAAEAVSQNRAQVRLGEDEAGARELKQLEKNLRQAQAGNVMNNEFLGRDLERRSDAAAGFQVMTAPQQPMAADQQAAETQWDKLQQAQEVVAAKVKPLRVNLPTHGVQYVFTQVLQTEVGRPMTVQFSAVNTRAASWPTRVGLSTLGFVLLWALVAIAQRQRAH